MGLPGRHSKGLPSKRQSHNASHESSRFVKAHRSAWVSGLFHDLIIVLVLDAVSQVSRLFLVCGMKALQHWPGRTLEPHHPPTFFYSQSCEVTSQLVALWLYGNECSCFALSRTIPSEVHWVICTSDSRRPYPKHFLFGFCHRPSCDRFPPPQITNPGALSNDTRFADFECIGDSLKHNLVYTALPKM